LVDYATASQKGPWNNDRDAKKIFRWLENRCMSHQFRRALTAENAVLASPVLQLSI
jgi:hypothetical protein